MAWLKDCEICNTGLCKAVDERKERGLSERAACQEMSEESKGLYSEDAILSRYRYYTGKTKRQPCEIHTQTEDGILQAANEIQERRLREISENCNDLEQFIKAHLQTDCYEFTPIGLKKKRESTKEEWLEYGFLLKVLTQSARKPFDSRALQKGRGFNVPEILNYETIFNPSQQKLERRSAKEIENKCQINAIRG